MGIKATSMKRIDEWFDKQMAEIKSSGNDWRDYARLGRELAYEYSYWSVCLDSELAQKYCRLKAYLDGWLMNHLSEDDVYNYFCLLD